MKGMTPKQVFWICVSIVFAAAALVAAIEFLDPHLHGETVKMQDRRDEIQSRSQRQAAEEYRRDTAKFGRDNKK